MFKSTEVLYILYLPNVAYVMKRKGSPYPVYFWILIAYIVMLSRGCFGFGSIKSSYS